MPAYGGSLFDPERFPWLNAVDEHGRLRVRLSDRAMLAVLNAVQVAVVGGEARLLSFRELDVEQIGYVYEGLLGYSAAYAPELIVGLDGKPGYEPELPLRELESISAAATSSADFAKRLLEHLRKTQEHAKPKTANQIAKTYASTDAELQAEARTKLRHTLLGDDETAGRLLPFAGLIRNDLRNFPYVVPSGGIVMTESPQRANTGTHYTPRSLAEEVVLHALQPLVYSPGPLDSENPDEWVLKSSAEILDLKVVDIAVGSGAFLVAAARYLADRLIEAREREGAPIDGEDPRRFAIREVVARCLYGADINGMAVEMCKLSLWLISMDPGRPFSFVDDRVFHGNSLLGVTSEAQLKAQHLYPGKREAKTPLRQFDVDKDLEDAARLRRELSSGQVDEADRMRSTRAKHALLAQARNVTSRLREVADGIIATGLLEGGTPGRRLEDRFDELADALRSAYPTSHDSVDRRNLEAIIQAGLAPTADTAGERWRPLHWVLEAPDVMCDNGGFDAVIGNPPFLGGKKLRAAIGENVRTLLVEVLARGERGSADLVAYFILRAMEITKNPVIGLIATSSVAEGETRSVGLDSMLNNGFQILRSVKSKPWPSKSANIRYAAIWMTDRPVSSGVKFIADGIRVPLINSSLDSGAANSEPLILRSNAGTAYIGSYVLGKGFVLDPSLASEMLEAAPNESDVILPYVNGEDLSSRPTADGSRFVINFFDWPVERAKSYAQAFSHLEHFVKPERQRRKPSGEHALRRPLPERWWQYADKRPALYRELANLSHALALPRASSTLMPVRVSTGQVFSDALVVFPTSDLGTLATLSSAAHQLWAITYGGTLGSTIRYTPSQIAETFPFPNMTPALDELGAQLDQDRREIMLSADLGLTALYNLVNSPEVMADPDINSLRSLHRQIDKAVMGAYGWGDIPLEHGFHTYRQMERWTVSPAARVEILDRLLEENHRRAALEAQPKSKSKRGKSFDESEKPEGALI
jgi:hypothetical protein